MGAQCSPSAAVPASTPASPCRRSSWLFKKVGPSGYMACGVKNIKVLILSHFTNPDGSSGASLGTYKCTLYFEMPPRFSPGEAATICARIKDEAEVAVQKRYGSMSPPEIAQTINSAFRAEMISLIKLSGGRITQTPQYPNTPVAEFGFTLLPNNGGCN